MIQRDHSVAHSQGSRNNEQDGDERGDFSTLTKSEKGLASVLAKSGLRSYLHFSNCNVIGIANQPVKASGSQSESTKGYFLG